MARNEKTTELVTERRRVGKSSFLLWKKEWGEWVMERRDWLTFSCPCLSWGAEIRTGSRLPPSSCWRRSSPPPDPSASPPPSSSPPGASASAARTYRAAKREETRAVMDRQDVGGRTRTEERQNFTELLKLTEFHSSLHWSIFFILKMDQCMYLHVDSTSASKGSVW